MRTIPTTRRSAGAARRLIGWAAAGLAITALALPLGACREEGTAERAGKQLDQTMGAAKDSAAEAAERAQKVAEEAAAKAKEVAADTAQKAKDVAAEAADSASKAAEEAKEKLKEKM